MNGIVFMHAVQYLVHFYSDRRSFHLFGLCRSELQDPPPACLRLRAAAPVELAFLSLEASVHMYMYIHYRLTFYTHTDQTYLFIHFYASLYAVLDRNLQPPSLQ